MSLRSRALERSARTRRAAAPRGALGPAERDALADLRDDLRRSDPELAAQLGRLGVPSALRGWLVVLGGFAALAAVTWIGGPAALAVAGIVLVVAAPLAVGLALSGSGGPPGSADPPE